MDFSDILSYASKLSKYTSAPPGFDQMSNDFKVDFEKPYPDEDRMRRGLLYRQYAGTHVLPNITDETGKVYFEKGDDSRGILTRDFHSRTLIDGKL